MRKPQVEPGEEARRLMIPASLRPDGHRRPFLSIVRGACPANPLGRVAHIVGKTVMRYCTAFPAWLLSRT